MLSIHKIWRHFPVLICLLAITSRAQLVAPNHGPYGSPTVPYSDGFWRPGVQGGIPSTNGLHQFCNVTVAIPGTNIVVPTDGVSDCAPAMKAAVSRCPSNQIVKLPPGQFHFLSSITVPSYVIVAGSGSGQSGSNDPNATVCYNNQTAGPGVNIFPQLFQFGSSFNFAYGGTTNSLIRGTNEIDVTTAYWEPIEAAGLYKYGLSFLIGVAETNDPNLWELQGYAGEGAFNNGSNVLSQMMTVTNLITNGSCVRIFTRQPFYYSMGLTNHPMVQPFGQQCFNSGIRDLEIAYVSANPGNSTGPVNFISSLNCWAYNIHVYRAPSDCFFFNQCTQCTVSTCWAEVSAFNGSGRGYQYHLLGPNSDIMVENNISQNARHAFIEESAFGGNVWFANFEIGDCPSDESSSTLTGMFISHSAGCGMDLCEENYGGNWWSDYLHGNALMRSAFRNWFTTGSQNPPDPMGDANYPGGFTVAFNRTGGYIAPTNWYFNALDNILGTPYFNNYSGAAYTNSASSVSFTYAWMVGTDNNVGGAQTDGNSWNTLYQDGNKDFVNGPGGETRWLTSPHAFNQSAVYQYRSAAPSYFGYPTNLLGVSFPMYGSDVTPPTYNPAQLRWLALNGTTFPVETLYLPVYSH